jgi:hypothetical protein
MSGFGNDTEDGSLATKGRSIGPARRICRKLEENPAANLQATARGIAPDAALAVWCGQSHGDVSMSNNPNHQDRDHNKNQDQQGGWQEKPGQQNKQQQGQNPGKPGEQNKQQQAQNPNKPGQQSGAGGSKPGQR